MKRNKDKKQAFSFSEMLITLGIIGIIAVIILPIILGTSDEKSRITTFKKAYSDLNNALQLAIAEDGINLRNFNNADDLVKNVFIPTLKISMTKTLGNTSGLHYFRTADGVLYRVRVGGKPGTDCGDVPLNPANVNFENACYAVLIDVNGDKPPNLCTTKALKDGINDRFVLLIFANGVFTGNSAAGDILAGTVYTDTIDAEEAYELYKFKPDQETNFCK